MTAAPTVVAEDIDLSALVHDHDDTAGDVGTELLDLPDGLRLTDPELMGMPAYAETLSAPFGFAQSLSAATAASYADYEWMSWAADVLRAAGVPVIEHPGWKTRGRPRSTGRFQPRGLLWHHDASTRGPSPYVAKFLAEIGRNSEGIPAPLAPFWVCRGCNAHEVGTWHVLAAGRCNHAGLGGGWGKIGPDAGNAVTAGVETDGTTGEPMPAPMYASLVKGSAALMLRMRSNPAQLLAGHLEYAEGRKNDPDPKVVPMGRGRTDVARAMLELSNPKPPAKPTTPKPPAKPSTPAKPTTPALAKFPGADRFVLGKKSTYVTQLGQWLVAAGYGKFGNSNGYQPGPTFTEYDRKNLAAFQRSRPALKGDPDGYPGPKTWELLQRAAAKR